MKQIGFLKASVLLAVVAIFLVTFALAAPMYVIVVNHSTKECALMYGGDECERCSPQEGWQVLEGAFGLEDCPSGYSVLDDAPFRPLCSPLKSTFCCSTPHTGSSGNCSDVVVNRATERCGFVEDINACPRLPQGWEKHSTVPLRLPMGVRYRLPQW